jgi:hypothetical protein
MTLILTLGNSEQVIQISDRRLSCNGKIEEVESSKAGVLQCLDARLALGFTGLARWDDFNTRDWLLDAIFKSGPPDNTANGILERLKLLASETFASHPKLRLLQKKDKRLSVMFSGYLDYGEPPILGFAILTNYQDFESHKDVNGAWDEFRIYYGKEMRPLNGEPILIERVGNWHATKASDRDSLQAMLEARKPANAILGKAVELLHEMADRSAAKKTIGKTLSAICIPRNRDRGIETGYYSDVNSVEYYMADAIILLEGGVRFVLKNCWVSAENVPLTIPKVRPKYPCPCGSGKKYKHCHGK